MKEPFHGIERTNRPPRRVGPDDKGGLVNLIEELRALAETYGVPGVDLSEVVILIDDLEIIPHDICRSHAILPVLVRGAHLFLAMAAPRDKRVIDEIEFVTGKKVFPYAAVANELSKTIDAAFDARNRRARWPVQTCFRL